MGTCSRVFPFGLLVVTFAVAIPTAAQCTKDVDCKGDRICVKGACVEPTTRGVPQDNSRADDRDALARSQLERRVGLESNNALALETFTKTNGYEQEMTRLYILEWQAEIRFVQQGWKPGDAIGGYWNDFQVLPAQSGFMSGSWQHFGQGTRIRLRGECAMRRTEQGWRIEQFDIKSYQKLASDGNSPGSSSPPSGPSATPSPTYHNSDSANPKTIAELGAAIARGEDVVFWVKYNLVETNRGGRTLVAAEPSHDEVVVSNKAVAFGPRGGVKIFSVSPAKILALSYNPDVSRVRLKVAIKNTAGDKESRKEFDFYHPATFKNSGNIICAGCDDSMNVLYALLQKVQGQS